ncbi:MULTISPECIES: SGNH/GDSL hydrolase family protein [Enterococcus]|uniref:SGNH/GDSL hydrolase family protein n=1 Tax=Enterococcus TaxID=1350 RepID=UPI0010F72400|nr:MULTISPECIES: SGNH/GDSL hydrolase family protein [Enterococcus]KAF1304794.1 lipase [Enterococcus sp. JM9B]
MKIMKGIIHLLLVVIGALLIFFVLNQAIPKEQARLEPVVASDKDSDKKPKVHYVAIGDSLTEGIGDQTNRGGFVPIVADDIQSRYNLTSVEVENYGVAGERSDQILKRMKKDTSIQENLKSADFITLTVGGNDLMKVIQDNFFGLTIKTFNKPIKKYQARVTELLDEIRTLNQQAPIYVLGIYNPFYLNFPEITDMQTIVDNWNAATEKALTEETSAYFIPINDLLYQGLDDKVGITSELEETDNSSSEGNKLSIVDNNVLYDGDKFHPNNIGYQLMANTVRDELIKTQDEWIKEQN